ncbi:ROK family transcriptional regulator [Streptomyces sp. NPDC051569]|uniref:ROK family transcriptional regulator n=1 Tax=Streptomyces sp. NPDC051569 TaxID=3365661 RepID=UPI0037BC356F
MAASPSTARAINDRLALRLLQQEGPLTAGQLKTLTGLSRPSVADLVERLQGSGLVQVVGETGDRRRGPNARLYGIIADRAHLAALDVRTHSVSVVVADLLGATLAEAVLPIGSDTATEAAVERAAALLERTAREAGAVRLHSVGIGAPGLVDPVTGELRDSSGLPAWHRRLVAVLQERLPATVLVENETNLAALAEQRLGAARGHDTFVLLWLGHGVGAAVVLDGKLRRGASGGAGEISFLPVPGTSRLPSAIACDGGFHSLVGSSAVTELAGLCGISATPGPQEPAAAAVVRAAVEAGGRGDAFLDLLAHRLAVGAAAVIAVLDPGRIVLAGEVGHAGGAALAARVETRLAAMTPLRTEVRPGTLGGAAVLRGALLTARDAAQDELFAPGA